MLAAFLGAGSLSEPDRPLQETTLAAQEAQIQRLEGTLQHYRNWAAQVGSWAHQQPYLDAFSSHALRTWLPSGCTEGGLAPSKPGCSMCQLSGLISDLSSASASLHLGTLPTRLDCHCKPGFWLCMQSLPPVKCCQWPL